MSFVRAHLTVILFLTSFSAGILAQSDPTVGISVSKDRITVGEHFQLALEVSYSSDLVVKLPGSEVELLPFEVLDLQSSGPEEMEPGLLRSRHVYTLTAFQTGELEIPPIHIGFVSTDGSREGEVSTDPLGVSVESVVTDQGSQLRDVKPPMEIPRDWLRIFLILTAVALLGAAGFWAWRRFSGGRPRDAGSLPEVPSIPPHLLAYQQLEKLQASKLLDQGEIKRYHVEVSEILRRYFEGRYGIDALEMTSGEILGSLPADAGPAEDSTRELLNQCDFVKFAKLTPLRSASERMLVLAFQIVDTTRPDPTETSTPGQPGGGNPAVSQDPVPATGGEV